MHYLFYYLPTLFYAHLMSEPLSKREQRKLQQTLRLFEASEVPQAKPKKKRKHNQRGITLIANQHNEEQENYAETKELSQLNSTPYRDTADHKQEGFLNHKYFPEQQLTLLNYLNQNHTRSSARVMKHSTKKEQPWQSRPVQPQSSRKSGPFYENSTPPQTVVPVQS